MIDLGVTFLDMAGAYGAGHNEVRFLAAPSRGNGTGADRDAGRHRPQPPMGAIRALRGESATSNAACEASLLRLGIDTIDLYYLHRRAEGADPIEDSIGAMAELVAEGKIWHLGLWEVSPAQLRRAHATHTITAVQTEYSPWTRDPEIAVLDALPRARHHLRGFLAGRSWLPGRRGAGSHAKFTSKGDMRIAPCRASRARPSQSQRGDRRARLPRWPQRHGVDRRPGRARVGAAAGRDASACRSSRSPAPSGSSWLEQNVAALDLELTDADLADLDPLGDRVVGSRY